MGLALVTTRDPAAYILALRESNRPTTAMLELVVEQFKTDMLERTARGLDWEGKAFAPYSEKGPYYYYPNGRIGGALKGAGRALAYGAAKRFHARINAGNRGAPFGSVTPGGGIKFASYGAFKRALGRGGVDLTGPKAPHMLQAIVKTTSGTLEVKLGIYGSEAARAQGHNQGTSRLPQRKFFAVSDADRKVMNERLLTLIKENRL